MRPMAEILTDWQTCAIDLINRMEESHRLDQDGLVIRDVVLGKLTARACQIAESIVVLLGAGHADTAFGVWRSLQEIEFTFQVIADDESDETAIRFADWGSGIYYRRERLRRNLGIGEMDDDVYSKLEVEYHALLNKYGKDFKIDSAWSGRSTFSRAESVGSADAYRKFYGAASSYIHVDIIGLEFPISRSNSHDMSFIVGPSVVGLDMPAYKTIFSLGSIVIAFAHAIDVSNDDDELRFLDISDKFVEMCEAIESIDLQYRAHHKRGKAIIPSDMREHIQAARKLIKCG